MVPIAILPLSKLSSSAVTVWVILSLLVHVTVVPAVTVSEAGENDIFTILTEFATGILFIGAVYPLFLPQETIANAEINSTNIFKYNNLFFINHIYNRVRQISSRSCTLNYYRSEKMNSKAEFFLNAVKFNN